MLRNENSHRSNVSAPTLPQRKPAPMLDDDAMQLVWESLSGIYGQQFFNSYGESHLDGAAEVWASALAGFTRDRLHYGLNACTKRTQPYPPTLNEFRALCLGSTDAPIGPMSAEDRAARDKTEHEYDLAHFRKMRDLAAGVGLDLWAREAEHGIPHRTRTRPADASHVMRVKASIAECFTRMVSR